MKYFLLFSLLLTSLFAEAKLYVGTSVGIYQENYTDAENSDSLKTAKVKFGYGDIDAYAMEISLEAIEKDSAFTSVNQSERYALNVALLKAFNFDIGFNPYLKAGFGSGYYKQGAADSTTMHFGNYTLGGGFFIPVLEHVDFEIGYEYKYISYESEDTTTTASEKSHGNIGYLGVNVRF